MSDWTSPPQFGINGDLPPVRSPLHRLPNMFTGRLGPVVGTLAVTKLATEGRMADPEFGEVFAWLQENRDSVDFLGIDHKKRVKSANASMVGRGLLFFVPPVAVTSYGLGSHYVNSRREILKIQSQTFWQREDPVEYLAPASVHDKKISYTVGLSSTRSKEFATTIGRKSGLAFKATDVDVSVSSSIDVTARLINSITRSEQRDVTKNVRVENGSTARSKAVAYWIPGRHLRISRLVLRDDRLAWQRLTEFEYFDDLNVSTTSAELNLGSS